MASSAAPARAASPTATRGQPDGGTDETTQLSRLLVHTAFKFVQREGPSIPNRRYAVAARRTKSDAVRSEDSDPATVEFWQRDADEQDRRNEDALRVAGCVLCTRANDGDIAGAHRVGPRTFLNPESASLIHVWKCRKEARRFHEALRRAAQAKFEHMVPSPVHVPLAGLVAHQGALVSVVWLPPLASWIPAPVAHGTTAWAAVTLLREALAIAPSASLPLLPGADGNLYLIACSPILTVGTLQVPLATGVPRPVPLRLELATRLPSREPLALSGPEASTLLLGTLIPAHVVPLAAYRLYHIMRPSGGGLSPDAAVADGTVGEEMHAVGLNLCLLPLLIAYLLRADDAVLPEALDGFKIPLAATADEGILSCIVAARSEMLARALKRTVRAKIDAVRMPHYALHDDLHNQILEGAAMAIEEFVHEPAAFDEVKQCAIEKFGFAQDGLNGSSAVFAFNRDDISGCLDAIAAFAGKRCGIAIEDSAVVGFDTNVVATSARSLHSDVCHRLGWLPFLPVTRGQTQARTAFAPADGLPGFFPGATDVMSAHLEFPVSLSRLGTLPGVIAYGLRDLFLCSLVSESSTVAKRLSESLRGLKVLLSGSGSIKAERAHGPLLVLAQQLLLPLVARHAGPQQVDAAAEQLLAIDRTFPELNDGGAADDDTASVFSMSSEKGAGKKSGLTPNAGILSAPAAKGLVLEPDAAGELCAAWQLLAAAEGLITFRGEDGRAAAAQLANQAAAAHCRLANTGGALYTTRFPAKFMAVVAQLGVHAIALADAPRATAKQLTSTIKSLQGLLGAHDWRQALLREVPATCMTVRPSEGLEEDEAETARLRSFEEVLNLTDDALQPVEGWDAACHFIGWLVVAVRHQWTGAITAGVHFKPPVTPGRLDAHVLDCEALVGRSSDLARTMRETSELRRLEDPETTMRQIAGVMTIARIGQALGMQDEGSAVMEALSEAVDVAVEPAARNTIVTAELFDRETFCRDAIATSSAWDLADILAQEESDIRALLWIYAEEDFEDVVDAVGAAMSATLLVEHHAGEQAALEADAHTSRSGVEAEMWRERLEVAEEEEAQVRFMFLEYEQDELGFLLDDFAVNAADTELRDQFTELFSTLVGVEAADRQAILDEEYARILAIVQDAERAARRILQEDEHRSALGIILGGALGQSSLLLDEDEDFRRAGIVASEGPMFCSIVAEAGHSKNRCREVAALTAAYAQGAVAVHQGLEQQLDVIRAEAFASGVADGAIALQHATLQDLSTALASGTLELHAAMLHQESARTLLPLFADGVTAVLQATAEGCVREVAEECATGAVSLHCRFGESLLLSRITSIASAIEKEASASRSRIGAAEDYGRQVIVSAARNEEPPPPPPAAVEEEEEEDAAGVVQHTEPETKAASESAVDPAAAETTSPDPKPAPQVKENQVDPQPKKDAEDDETEPQPRPTDESSEREAPPAQSPAPAPTPSPSHSQPSPAQVRYVASPRPSHRHDGVLDVFVDEGQLERLLDLTQLQQDLARTAIEGDEAVQRSLVARAAANHHGALSDAAEILVHGTVRLRMPQPVNALPEMGPTEAQRQKRAQVARAPVARRAPPVPSDARTSSPEPAKPQEPVYRTAAGSMADEIRLLWVESRRTAINESIARRRGDLAPLPGEEVRQHAASTTPPPKLLPTAVSPPAGMGRANSNRPLPRGLQPLSRTPVPRPSMGYPAASKSGYTATPSTTTTTRTRVPPISTTATAPHKTAKGPRMR